MNIRRCFGRHRLLLPVVAAVALAAFAATALSAGADRDLAFGDSGLVTTDFGASDDEGQAVALQADSKIVVVGGRNIDADFDSNDFALARYETDGSLDPTFDGDGKVITDFGTNRDEARAVAIQNDGAIVVGGWNAFDFQLARYLPNGALDPDFGDGGHLVTDLGGGDFVADLAIQADGGIVAVGGNGNFALARYLPDGTLDPSFSADGKVTTQFDGGSAADAVALQADGKLVVVGRGPCNPSCRDFALARYNPDGSLDTTFDGDGKLTTDFGGDFDAAGDVALQDDGRIVVAGRGATGTGRSWDGFAIARYNVDGRLDASFDGDGKTILADDAGPPPPPAAEALALLPGGKILVGGVLWRGPDGANFALARLNTDGTLDRGFSSDGWSDDDFEHRHDVLFGLAVQGDGMIVAAGFSAELVETRASSDFAVIRYLPDGGDTMAPESELGEGPAQGSFTRSTSARFVFTGRDDRDAAGQLTFACSLDGGPVTACVSPLTLGGLTDGRHEFKVVARDRAGNVDRTPASRTWTVDSTSPETTLTRAGPARTRNRMASFAFVGTDRISTSLSFECGLDDGARRPCTSPYVVGRLANGRHHFIVRAIDQAGNRDPSAAAHEWTVDTRPPAKPRVRGPLKTANRRPVYRFSSADAISHRTKLGFRCRLDSRRLRPCAPAHRVRLRPGKHALFVAAVDEAGNQSRVVRIAIVISQR